MDLESESGPQGETVKSDPNERIAFGSERPASEEEQPDVEGHRYLGTEDPDERIALGTEQAATEEGEPDVEGHRLLATEDPDERIALGTEPPA